MSNNTVQISQEQIQNLIFTIRGMHVMIDRDLASIYGVEVKRLNEQVKRNIERFLKEFRFQLSDNEKKQLVANCDRFKTLKHSSVNPYAFTEQGVSMLSAVLRSKTAIKASINIDASLKDLGKKWFAFSKMTMDNWNLLQRLNGGDHE